MPQTLQVEVVSAEEAILSGEAEFVVLPGECGELGIYPQHTPLISRIRPGAVRIRLPQQVGEELVFVAGGFLEVQPNKVIVLANTAIRGRDLDEARANEARRRAERELAHRDASVDHSKVHAELASAIAQLATIHRYLKK
jgi:F-type H+-transporting ATPase subunit epsilon